MKSVNPKNVFAPSNAKSPFDRSMNPTRIRSESLDRISVIAEAGDMAKAEVIRYCVEFALDNADWFVAAHMKRVFKEKAIDYPDNP